MKFKQQNYELTTTQLTYTCLNLTMGIIEKGVKYVQS